MPLVECPRPDPDALAIANPADSLASLLAFGVIGAQEKYWQRRSSTDGDKQIGGTILGLLGHDLTGIATSGQTPTPEAWQAVSQRAAQSLSILALSRFLRSDEFRTIPLNPQDKDATHLPPLTFDFYTPELICVHVSSEVLAHLAEPLLDPNDTWYRNGDLFVHRERPPQPSAGALENHPELFNREAFYEDYTTLTPLLARPNFSAL